MSANGIQSWILFEILQFFVVLSLTHRYELMDQSTIKMSYQIDVNHWEVFNAIEWTAGLDPMFVQLKKEKSDIRLVQLDHLQICVVDSYWSVFSNKPLKKKDLQYPNYGILW